MLVDILQKNKERIQKFRETEESKYIYQNKPDKACFQHNMTYIYFKNLSRRTAADKILHDKRKIRNMMDINEGFHQTKN